MRPTKDEYYLGIAQAVSRRSTCLRRQYGAVIVSGDEIISTGYNGGPRGDENCCDTGECWREKHKIPHGERYEECVAVHAEANAIISAARKDMIGATLYLYGEENGLEIPAVPCKICEKLIKNAGIGRVVARKIGNDSTKAVNGRWERTLIPLTYKCSVCGYSMSAEEWKFQNRNFCPNCLVKMDLPCEKEE